MSVRLYGPFAPDRIATADILVGGKNVWPKSDQTYGPINGFQPVYAALAERAQGAFFTVDAAGNTGLWAGTASKLYALLSGTAFADVSKAGGYHCKANEFWEFERSGPVVMAWQIDDPIQSYTLGSSTAFADLSSGAPSARHGAMVNNFLLVGNTNDPTYGPQPDGLWWSAYGNVTSWPLVGTSAAAAVQSGRVNISGRGGWIQRIAPRVGTLDAIVLQERAVSRCIYVGSPDVFNFQPMEGARGTPCPQSAALYGGVLFYVGEDGLYANDGTNSTPIGDAQIDKYFFDNVNQTLLSRVQGVIDPVNKLYILGFPSLASSGTIDKMLLYSINGHFWAPPTESQLELLTRLGSVGYTLESLDAFGTVETITTSFDSRVWMGSGRPLLAAFDTSHRAGGFSGPALEAILETGDGDYDSARAMSLQVRPMVQGSSAAITCAFGFRQSRNEPVVYGDYRGLNREGVVPFRVNARHIRTLLRIAGGATWEHIYGNDFESNPVSKL